MKQDARRVYELVEAIKPILVGEKPAVQGAALADLLAMWLAGHVSVGDPTATEAMRESALELHLMAVRGLIPIEYKQSIEPQLKRRQH
jgi:hypothetical protein